VVSLLGAGQGFSIHLGLLLFELPKVWLLRRKEQAGAFGILEVEQFKPILEAFKDACLWPSSPSSSVDGVFLM
jgi:hypothetical protein